MKTARNAVMGLILALCFGAGAASAQTLIKISSPAPTNDPAQTALELFATKFSERTNHAYVARIFPSSQLGNDRQIVQGLQSGAIEMAYFGITAMVTFAPDFDVFDLPYVIQDRTDVARIVEGPLGQTLMAQLPAAGMHGLAFAEAGGRSVFLRKALTSPETLKGLKLRVPISPAFIAAFEAFGAIPTPLSFAELYSALQQGVIDGGENSLITYYTYKYYEVAPHFYFTNHAFVPSVYVASEKFFSSLPPAIQKIMVDTAVEVGRYHRQLEWDKSDQTVPLAEAKGATFHRMDLTPLKEAAPAAYSAVESKISPAIMALARQELEKARKTQ